MLNQVVLVGRIVEGLEIKELENGKKVANIKIAIPRSWKNAEGEYETDFVPLNLYDNIASNTVEYCGKGDIVGVKGRIQVEENNIQIIVEKLTFLSSKKTDEEEQKDS